MYVIPVKHLMPTKLSSYEELKEVICITLGSTNSCLIILKDLQTLFSTKYKIQETISDSKMREFRLGMRSENDRMQSIIHFIQS